MEFDRQRGKEGNDYITHVEWTDKYGDTYWGDARGSDGREIPDEIRLQIALQIAGEIMGGTFRLCVTFNGETKH